MQPQHCDPDVLALAAVDNLELTPPDARHLAECPACAADYVAFQNVVRTGREGRDVELVDPPESVWRGIETDIAADGAPDVAPVTRLSDRRPPAAASRPRSRWLPIGVAAAAGALLGGIITGSVVGGDPGQPPAPQVVASAQLAALPDGPVQTVGTGSAMFEKDADGTDLLVVDTKGLEEPDGFYQVWLLDPKSSGMVPVGAVASGDQQATFTLPKGIQPEQYSVVDISDEPLDGDPRHSKVSVLRGQLAI